MFYMKKFLRVLCMILAIVSVIVGVLLGCHATFYQMFYGGIMNMVEGASIIPIDALLIAKGAVKLFLCAVPGVLVGLGGFIISSGFFAIWCWLDD